VELGSAVVILCAAGGNPSLASLEHHVRLFPLLTIVVLLYLLVFLNCFGRGLRKTTT
jgi:hypothetical protein